MLKLIPDVQLKAMPNYLAPLTLQDVEGRINQSKHPEVIAKRLDKVRQKISAAHSVAQLLLPAPGYDKHGEERITALLEGLGTVTPSPEKVGLIRMARLFEQYGKFDLVKRCNECIEMLLYRLIAHSELSSMMRMSERSMDEVGRDIALASQIYREQLFPAYLMLAAAGSDQQG
ncbi:MAG: hypothetical protein K2X09_03135 [Rickettsiales bacterium]|nr:hypothetical protein [Rickettsiales bacterium]